MNPRTIAFAVLAVLALGTSAASLAQTAPGAVPPPAPPLPNTNRTATPALTPAPSPSTAPSGAVVPTSAPTATPAPAGKRGRKGNEAPKPGASPTETPPPPQFTTMDGVWEVQLQPLDGSRTKYSHLFITQKGNDLAGTWKRDAKTVLPFKGTFDGRLFKLTVTDGTKTLTMSGYAENFGDMVGLLTIDGDTKTPGTPFTASHRKKERILG